MDNRPPVRRLILTRNEPSEGGVIRKLQKLDGLMTGGAAVGLQGEEQRGMNTALRGTGGNGPGGHRQVSLASHAASCHTGSL